MSSFNHNVIKHKVGLLNLAEELGNVSKACKLMGFSRDTFYQYQAAKEDGGVEALLDKNRRKPNLKNRVDPAIEDAVVAYTTDFPAYGQTRASNELRKLGTFVSPSGVRLIWLRHDLHNFKLRLRALEKLFAESGMILTEAQVQALEKRRTMILPTARSRRHILDILEARTRSTSARSKALAAFTSKPSSTRVFKMGSGQAVHDQDADHCRRHAQ